MNENDFKFNAIMSSCKYLLPCGRCEMTKKKCTADPTMTYTIQRIDYPKNGDVARILRKHGLE